MAYEGFVFIQYIIHSFQDLFAIYLHLQIFHLVILLFSTSGHLEKVPTLILYHWL